MSDAIQITVATSSEENAHVIAEMLVTRRLAASCWVSGPITSRYWWKGVVEQAQEWVCTAKTRTDLYSKVEQAIKEVHPYEVPGILATPVVAGSQTYFEWINRETAAKTPQEQTGRSKEHLIQELIDAHEQLLAAATAAHERGAKRVGDTWGPREVLAHVAGWEAMAVARIPRIVPGMPPVKYVSIAQHAAMDDAINATVITLVKVPVLLPIFQPNDMYGLPSIHSKDRNVFARFLTCLEWIISLIESVALQPMYAVSEIGHRMGVFLRSIARHRDRRHRINP